MAEPLFPPGFLARLEQLRLVVRGPVAARHTGERRSVRRGAGVEFADHRAYVPGDDLRRVDWDAYARLERLFLKLFHEEQEATLYLLVDASRSMDWGVPNKFRVARQVSGALGYLALGGYDRLVASLWAARPGAQLGPLRGLNQVGRLWSWLERAAPLPGPGAPAAAALALCANPPQPGVAVLVTDGLGPVADFRAAITLLRGARLEVALVQVLAPEELHPPLAGDLRLLDSETGLARDVSVTPAVVARYQERLAAHLEGLAAACAGRGAAYVPVSAAVSLDDLVTRSLRRAGLVG